MHTLLLPGMDGTGRLFAPLLDHLDARLCARAIAYPTHEVLGYAELEPRIDLPAGPLAIVAESFSGPLAIRLAHAHADRVRALILVASFVRCPWALARLARPVLFRIRPPDFALRGALLGHDATDEEVRALRSAIDSVEPAVLFARLREIVRVDVRRELAATNTPVAYLAGSRDRLVGPRSRREIEQLRPDLRVEVFDAPHLILQRQPRAAGQWISRFLLGHDTPTP